MYTLDRYILSRFLYNFLSSFLILMLIFIFQAIWFFIDEWAGKGIDLLIVGKFLVYYSPNLIPMVLPLTVLLASIMTFGSLAENYEFAAMKASGISLFRAMRPLIIFITVLSIGTFFFANSVIPEAELKSYNLRRNIAQAKPALAITEGIFNNIPETDINIKVNDKYGDNDQLLSEVVIHKLTNGGLNNQVVKSKEGELTSKKGSNYLQLVLKDGHFYEDIQGKTISARRKVPFAKAYFDTYTMNVDLSQLSNDNLEKENVSNTHKMLNARELDVAIDSLYTDNREVISSLSKSIQSRTGFTNIDGDHTAQRPVKDTIDPTGKSIPELMEFYEPWRQSQIVDMAKNNMNSTKRSIEAKRSDIQRRIKLLNVHFLSLHQKFALPIACFILFFVGAPLGAIIRKGGLGLPMVLAIALFLTYYFIGIFTKNYAEDGSMDPVWASWVSTLIMLPLGIWLTRRATADKAVFDPDSISEKFFNLFNFIRKKDSTEAK
ncbi:LptF/LptG family permease [Robertkochia sediminum]|uniref:LptF/LptG family permease n=1 Tax=Robertkochia sediminum TaxID=2785326 RepID=UPI001931A401|nr:LptF/LptG family permease [Robertkochia sediminum]MBL7473331.1 LptF/LptG family permease [Robertkochia sediminum]